MAIQYGVPSNYQQIAAQGQQIALELRRMQQEAEQQKAAQLTALLQNASAQNAQAMQNAAQMRFRQQEREADAQQQMQIERERSASYQKRLEQEWQYRGEIEKQQALAKYGYIGPGAEQQFANDLEASGLTAREFATALEANRRQREALDKDAIESLGMPYMAAAQKAQSLGLDYPTLKNIAADKDPNRGYGVSPTTKATIQRLETAYADMADDPEFQDADGLAMMAELRQKINAMYQPSVFFREKPQTIGAMIGAERINPQSGVRWEQTGENAGMLVFPDGSRSFLYTSPNRSTGQLELHQAAAWDAPKPDESGGGMSQADIEKMFMQNMIAAGKDEDADTSAIGAATLEAIRGLNDVRSAWARLSAAPAQPAGPSVRPVTAGPPAPVNPEQYPPVPTDPQKVQAGQVYRAELPNNEVWLVTPSQTPGKMMKVKRVR